jgi:uncharacterized membrane protein YdjX (TVP38/TMEM64 family)
VRGVSNRSAVCFLDPSRVFAHEHARIMRLLSIFLLLALLVIVPFLLWGGAMEARFSLNGAVDWLRSLGGFAWIAGIGLLVLDLILPVPSTVVMSALGLIYGPVLGGVFSAAGSFLAGLIGYLICRKIGRRAALWIAGEKDLLRGERLFSRAGGWLVAWSRWLPVLQEVITCMAGLARMPLRSFTLALACGCVPMGFAFAAVGNVAVAHPGTALALSILAPPVLWVGVHFLVRGREAGV